MGRVPPERTRNASNEACTCVFNHCQMPQTGADLSAAISAMLLFNRSSRAAHSRTVLRWDPCLLLVCERCLLEVIPQGETQLQNLLLNVACADYMVCGDFQLHMLWWLGCDQQSVHCDALPISLDPCFTNSTRRALHIASAVISLFPFVDLVSTSDLSWKARSHSFRCSSA